MTTPRDIHNASAGDLVRQIVEPTLAAGGDFSHVLLLLERVVMGVMMVAVRLGGDDKTLDILVEAVRRRLAEERLGGIKVQGNS